MLIAALLTAAFVAGAITLLLRSDDNAPIEVLLPAQDEGAGGDTGNGAAGESPAAELMVYVSGAVQEPGVYRLEPGDRLVDALEAAGGAEEGAQLHLVNLSMRVVDQGHYHIPSDVEPLWGEIAAPSSSGTGQGDLMNLNSASAQSLEALPSIGARLADAIVDYRESHGDFQSVEDITNVPGIGPRYLPEHTRPCNRESFTLSESTYSLA